MVDLYTQALRYLARREYSAYELKRKLIAKSSDRAAIDATLARLLADGLQSDRRFAESYIRSRIHAGIGPLRIVQELRQKHLSPNLITEFLPQEEEYWLDILQRVCQKKYHCTKIARGNQKEYARCVRFLLQRGFAQEMIIRFLSKGEAL